MRSIEVDGFYTLCLRDAIRPMQTHRPTLRRAAADLVWFARSRAIEQGPLLVELERASRSVEWVTAFEMEIHGRALRLGRMALEEAFAATQRSPEDMPRRDTPPENRLAR
jgi:hypothetical protein